MIPNPPKTDAKPVPAAALVIQHPPQRTSYLGLTIPPQPKAFRLIPIVVVDFFARPK